MDVNRTTLTIAAGVAGTLFLGYCIYFDKKRRSDPEYKKKIRERKLGGGHHSGEELSRRGGSGWCLGKAISNTKPPAEID